MSLGLQSNLFVLSWKTAEEFICTEITRLGICFWKWVSSANRQNLWKIPHRIIIQQKKKKKKKKKKKITDCKNLENSRESIFDRVYFSKVTTLECIN